VFSPGIVKFVHWPGYGQDGRRIVVRLPAKARDFYFLETVQKRAGVHPASYLTAVSPRVKRPEFETYYWSIWCWGKEYVELSSTSTCSFIVWCLINKELTWPSRLYSTTLIQRKGFPRVIGKTALSLPTAYCCIPLQPVLVHVNQPKELVAGESCDAVIATNIPMNVR
jgi:hypothetical protein